MPVRLQLALHSFWCYSVRKTLVTRNNEGRTQRIGIHIRTNAKQNTRYSPRNVAFANLSPRPRSPVTVCRCNLSAILPKLFDRFEAGYSKPRQIIGLFSNPAETCAPPTSKPRPATVATLVRAPSSSAASSQTVFPISARCIRAALNAPANQRRSLAVTSNAGCQGDARNTSASNLPSGLFDDHVSFSSLL